MNTILQFFIKKELACLSTPLDVQNIEGSENPSFLKKTNDVISFRTLIRRLCGKVV